uniref:Conotoxin VnMKLT1-021 n=1 Tax=Conus ventricosus TaxID=117992 RepID=O1612_CONVE|nr:RecName: Full=Conotoxin VnMKLT1-021; Flags: Precursor [Conus ventricosus]AAG60464.1 conotoxin scaffold VI/VII precursor [Conus ventricosus]
MKLTCVMIVAVLFLTAWTFVTADDPRDGPDTAVGWRKLFSEARDEMKNREASKLNERGCIEDKKYCGILPFANSGVCCSYLCIFVCVPKAP